ncbi:hypothetical protein B0T26DRAFT_737918 [Lasiosphaeria miniovina]|uniref:DUF7924 domain-containing protein n=1 Tax=Lasiosphaeria miniovina TaxID=1954250 RepID=A0AA40B3Q5_9PEZI|nr:uncharacterized protein B0T26DRAFT_737918 [Lasiosphaeria miniovina]KAK0727124.1 hypothetical protein B0T26DRAFT_737918 [Lasiosphaeria miniovina]
MNGRVSKAWTRGSRVQLSKALQETLLDAVAGNIAGAHSGDFAGAATPVQARKRRLDGTESDPSPAKRARLTRTDTQQPGVEKSEQAGKLVQTTLQQPKPNQHPYASFLKDFVDPVHPAPGPASVHTFVSEWLESVGSDRDKHCRSDSHLHHSDGDHILRQLTRSAPEMGYTRYVDGFAYRASHPGLVAPSDLNGATSGSGRSSGRSLVEDPDYRDLNLAANNVYMRHPCDPIPEHITDLVDYVGQDRDSPGPSVDEVRQDRDLHDLSMGAGEPQVEEYFRTNIYPYPKSIESLQRSDRQPMAKHTIPSTGSILKVSNLVPDMLYGYNRHGAFPQQQSQLISMGREPRANNQGLIYPFFVIEFKGDGPTGVGRGLFSCVNIAEHLNRQLRNCKNDEVRPINSAAFSVAMSGTEARLFISWKHDELEYYMANVESFLLQRPDHYLEFRKYVRNIIDWGKDKRLKEIRNSLDSLLEESRQRASEAAKSRLPPSDGSATSSGEKRKSSSSRRNSSRSNGVQEQSGGANEPWEWTKTTLQDAHNDYWTWSTSRRK